MKKKSKKQQAKSTKPVKHVPPEKSVKSIKQATPAATERSVKASILKEKSSIIVLVIAAVIFFGAIFLIYSEDILKGAGEIFSPYGNEMVEFEEATVIKVNSEELEADEIANNALKGTQELAVIVKSGRYKGEEMIAYNYIGPLSGVTVAKGDSVTLTLKTHMDGKKSATVYEFNRIPILAGFLVLFFAVVIFIGRRTGLKSLIGLVFTVVCLFVILIPLLLKGAPTILSTFLMCVFIALVCFTILGGVHRKTASAFLGTIAGAFLAMIFGLGAQHIAKIDGLRLEDAEAMLQLKYAADWIQIDIKGLLVAGIIISALGAVMDVAMSISSALEEVHAANPSLTRNELFKSGMNIGRDMVGTMTNTLILAFLGSEFTLIIFLYARDLTFYHLFSTAFIALETISGLSASIGMVLSIPLTAFISASLIERGKLKHK